MRLEPLGVIPLKTMTVIREAKAVAGRETIKDFQKRFSLGFESEVKKTETSRAKRMATGEKYIAEMSVVKALIRALAIAVPTPKIGPKTRLANIVPKVSK